MYSIDFLFTLITCSCFHQFLYVLAEFPHVHLHAHETFLRVLPRVPTPPYNPATVAHNESSIRSLLDDCTGYYKAKFPHLMRRFTDARLEQFCKRTHIWAHHVKKPHVKANMTVKQREFLKRVQSCATSDECRSIRMHNKIKRQSGQPSYRQECRTKSQADLNRLFRAFWSLKTATIDGRSRYDLIVFDHLPQQAPEAHFGPSFLPYHRELLKQFEAGLREVDPGVSLCYWDSTLDQALPDPTHSILWTDSFFGNGQGYVTSGPFANWPSTATIPEANQFRLYRLVGRSASSALYMPQDIDHFLQQPNYESFCCFCRDPTFEILHGGIHDFVGGHMTYLASSPNDPAFFAHHMFIDYIWETWRRSRQTPQQRESDYPPPERSCGSQYALRSPMRPFPNMVNMDGLSESYSQYFTYAPTPTCGNGLCSGDFLVCNTMRNRCMSKIRPGGNCRGLEQVAGICYGRSTCINGVCATSRFTKRI